MFERENWHENGTDLDTRSTIPFVSRSARSFSYQFSRPNVKWRSTPILLLSQRSRICRWHYGSDNSSSLKFVDSLNLNKALKYFILEWIFSLGRRHATFFCSFIYLFRRQCSPVVRALALRCRDPGFKTPLVEIYPGSSWFNFLAALVNSQLVCLRPVGIFKSCSVQCSEILVTVATCYSKNLLVNNDIFLLTLRYSLFVRFISCCKPRISF